MLQTEFEERYGKRVSPDEYSFIERVYMYCPTVDKDRFCKEWKDKKLNSCHVVADLTDYAKRLELEKQQWQHTAEQFHEVGNNYKRELAAAVEAKRQLAEVCERQKAEVENLALALLRNSREEDAIDAIGYDEVIALKCAHGLYINDEDKAYLAERLRRK